MSTPKPDSKSDYYSYGLYPPTPTHPPTHINFTFSSLWSNQSMLGHFFIVLNLRNSNLCKFYAAMCFKTHFLRYLTLCSPPPNTPSPPSSLLPPSSPSNSPLPPSSPSNSPLPPSSPLNSHLTPHLSPRPCHNCNFNWLTHPSQYCYH